MGREAREWLLCGLPTRGDQIGDLSITGKIVSGDHQFCPQTAPDSQLMSVWEHPRGQIFIIWSASHVLFNQPDLGCRWSAVEAVFYKRMDRTRTPNKPHFHLVTMENRLYECLHFHYSVAKAEWDGEGSTCKSEYTVQLGEKLLHDSCHVLINRMWGIKVLPEQKGD